ncbi:unnamed protein product [Urochloa decumbens]|uniref:Uncharacterized protein n=1 Tax=Urochloa decumbens TaxID=240449 RepID=A0ABC8X081_9POAL
MLPAAVAGMLPRRQAIARASVSALVASLPLLYVSLLRPPPAALAGDTAFWFLMSNCVIAAIVATSDDAGTLLFRSAAADDDHAPCDGGRGGGGGLSFASAVQTPPPVPVQTEMMVPFPASPQQDVPPAVDMNGGRVQREAASAVTSSYSTHHALPSLIEGEEEDGDAASEPSVVEINHPVRRDEKEEVTTDPRTVKGSTVEVEAQGEEASDEVISLATIEEGSELAEPEPWSPRVLRSTKSLPEEEAADVEWSVPLHSRPADDPAQDKGVVAAREGELRRSATVGSKPAAEESDEYWQLSDEELNRRVEDFIARFNREMRRQVEQEAGI